MLNQVINANLDYCSGEVFDYSAYRLFPDNTATKLRSIAYASSLKKSLASELMITESFLEMEERIYG